LNIGLGWLGLRQCHRKTLDVNDKKDSFIDEKESNTSTKTKETHGVNGKKDSFIDEKESNTSS
jgi:hypothetical protein